LINCCEKYAIPAGLPPLLLLLRHYQRIRRVQTVDQFRG